MYRLKVPYTEADARRRFTTVTIPAPADHSPDVEWLAVTELPDPTQLRRRATDVKPPPVFVTDRKNFEFWHIAAEADAPIERPELPDAQTVAFVEAERADAPTH